MTTEATVASCSATAYAKLPRHEADRLLDDILEIGRATRFAHPEAFVEREVANRLNASIERRRRGEPLAYIVGMTEFLGIELSVDRRVLIPRLDTEILIETALGTPGCHVLDIGTGSGAIAIAIATAQPTRQVVATDLDAHALAVAAANVARLGLSIPCVQTNLADAFGPHFDLVVSNPPYIEPDDPHLDRGDLRYEPSRALVGGRVMLDELVYSASRCLVPGGRLLIEHGYDQGDFLRARLAREGFVDIETHIDLERRERVTAGTMPKATRTI